MTALNAADLVVIAGRTLGISTDAVLAQMDIAAAEQALAEARPSGLDLPDPTAAAAAGVSLVHALLRHRPFPRHGRQVAGAAGRSRSRGLVPPATGRWPAPCSPSRWAGAYCSPQRAHAHRRCLPRQRAWCT